MKKAAFFDRDGTIIHDIAYLSNISDIKILEPAIQLARTCQQQGYELFVVTNQSGVARGMFDEAFVQETHQAIDRLFAQHGVHFTQWYYCPHHPTKAVKEQYSKDCDCRKPKPGMLLQAALEHNINLAQSLLFGNEPTDLEAGRAAGCKTFDVTQLFAIPPADYAKLIKNSSKTGSFSWNSLP